MFSFILVDGFSLPFVVLPSLDCCILPSLNKPVKKQLHLHTATCFKQACSLTGYSIVINHVYIHVLHRQLDSYFSKKYAIIEFIVTLINY